MSGHDSKDRLLFNVPQDSILIQSTIPLWLNSAARRHPSQDIDTVQIHELRDQVDRQKNRGPGYLMVHSMISIT